MSARNKKPTPTQKKSLILQREGLSSRSYLPQEEDGASSRRKTRDFISENKRMLANKEDRYATTKPKNYTTKITPSKHC